MNNQYEEFCYKYQPIKNHINTNASFDDTMFETFGAELEYVEKQAPELIWTICEEDGTMYLDAGLHTVNRLGYIIASVVREPEDNDKQYTISTDKELEVS